MIYRAIILFILLVGVPLLSPASLFPSPPRETPLQKIQLHSARHNLDWRLVLAVILVESEGNPRALSRKGARGLMQVMPVHVSIHGSPEILYDIDTNLSLGCSYLSEMIKRFGHDGGIQAYNLGEKHYSRSRRSRAYLYRVLLTYRNINNISPMPR
jgi:soluble lytic murein transglycosylase-like protein